MGRQAGSSRPKLHERALLCLCMPLHVREMFLILGVRRTPGPHATSLRMVGHRARLSEHTLFLTDHGCSGTRSVVRKGRARDVMMCPSLASCQNVIPIRMRCFCVTWH